MSRGRRAALTLASGTAGSVVTVVVGMVVTPVLVRHLGDERYGAVRALTEVFGLVMLVELGLGGALGPLLARPLAGGDRPQVVAILAAASRIYLGVVVLAAAALGVVATIVPYLVPVAAENVADLRLAVLVSGVGLLALPLAPSRAALEAGQQGYLVNLALLAQAVGTAVLAVALATAGGGIAGQVAATVGGGLGFTLGLAAVVVWRYPEYPAAVLRHPPRAVTRELWRQNGHMFLFNLGSRVSFMCDALVVAAMVAPAAVTPFVLTQRLVVLVAGQVVALGNSTWAVLADVYHRDGADRLNRELVRLTTLTGVLGATAVLPVAALNRPFVGLWVGPDRYAGDLVTGLAAANALAMCYTSLWGWALSGTGRVRTTLPCLFVGSVVNVGVSLVATWLIGPAGPLVGTTVQQFGVSAWWLPLILRREFSTPVRGLLVAAARPLLVAAPLAAAVMGVASVVSPESLPLPQWGRWVVVGVGLAVAAAGHMLLAWRLVLTPADRRELSARVFRR